MPWLKCRYCGEEDPDKKHHCSGREASLYGYKRGRAKERESCLRAIHELWQFLESDLTSMIERKNIDSNLWTTTTSFKDEKELIKYLNDHFELTIKQIVEGKDEGKDENKNEK